MNGKKAYDMRFIGITGGVGAGKSELLHYIEKEFLAKVLLADELAHELMTPGTACFAQIQKAFIKRAIMSDFFGSGQTQNNQRDCPSCGKAGNFKPCGKREGTGRLRIFYSGSGAFSRGGIR